MLAILFGVICDAAAMPSEEDVESKTFSSLVEDFLLGFLFCLGLAEDGPTEVPAVPCAASSCSCGGGESELMVFVSLWGGLIDAEYELGDRGRDIDERLLRAPSELVRLSKLCI